MCEYSSFETGNLKSHMMHKHKEEKPYKCDQCNYTCVSYGQLQQHMKTFQVQPMQQKLHWKEQAHKTFQNSHDLALFVHNNFEIQNNQFCVVWLNWKLSRHLIVVNVWYFDIKDNNHYNDEQWVWWRWRWWSTQWWWQCTINAINKGDSVNDNNVNNYIGGTNLRKLTPGHLPNKSMCPWTFSSRLKYYVNFLLHKYKNVSVAPLEIITGAQKISLVFVMHCCICIHISTLYPLCCLCVGKLAILFVFVCVFVFVFVLYLFSYLCIHSLSPVLYVRWKAVGTMVLAACIYICICMCLCIWNLCEELTKLLPLWLSTDHQWSIIIISSIIIAGHHSIQEAKPTERLSTALLLFEPNLELTVPMGQSL